MAIPLIKLAGVMRDADNFRYLYWSRDTWARAEDLEHRCQGLIQVAVDERIRREGGLRVLGRRLLRAAAPLEHKWTDPLALFLADFDHGSVQRGDKYYNASDVVQKIGTRAKILYGQQGGGETDEPADITGQVAACRGVSDLVLIRVTRVIDKMPSVARHLVNGGKLKRGEYAEFTHDAKHIRERAAKSGVDVSSLDRVLDELQLAELVPAIQSLSTYRSERLESYGLSAAAVQPGYEDVRDAGLGDEGDPNAPYWPASDFRVKYGIPPSRLRQAAKRGQIPTKKVRSLPYYSLPVARAIWSADFSDEFP